MPFSVQEGLYEKYLTDNFMTLMLLKIPYYSPLIFHIEIWSIALHPFLKTEQQNKTKPRSFLKNRKWLLLFLIFQLKKSGFRMAIADMIGILANPGEEWQIADGHN